MRTETGSTAPLDAESTALRVLHWAAADLNGASRPAPPLGLLRAPKSLVKPGQRTLSAISELIRDTGARLGTGRPPFGDPGPAGLGVLFLAAAIGGWEEHDAAVLLAEAIKPPRLVVDGSPVGAWAESLARHAVVAPVMSAPAFIRYDEKVLEDPDPADIPEEPLAELLLRMSPLTSVLHRPAATSAASGSVPETAAAMALLTRPRGPAILQNALARWSDDLSVLAWRTELLQRFALSNSTQQRAVAVDTYVTARLRYGAEWDRLLHAAARSLRGRGKPEESAIATARYWAPLNTLWTNDRELIRARPYLTGYERALALVDRHRLTATGTR